MSDQSRRKLLKSIAAGSSVIVAGKSLPESWSRPVVDSVMLPAHAQTSTVAVYSQTQGYDIPLNTNGQIPNQIFTFNLGGVVPTGDGTVTISNLQGDLNDGAIEQWTIQVGGVTVGLTNNGQECGAANADQVMNVSQADLLNAISGGNIEITALNGGGIQDFCSTGNNRMDVTLSFSGV